jgi:hypothetical protein
MKRIATHSAPDADALVAAWLAQRFLFPGEASEVVFVPRDYRPPPVPAHDAVVDVGRAHDPARLLFDHKPPAFEDRDSTCATRLLWEHLLALGRPVAHLADLVQAVHDGDAVSRRGGSQAYKRSRESGLHALVAAARIQGHPDAGMHALAARWLDGHEAGLRAGTRPKL